jgi:hypothetical protein
VEAEMMIASPGEDEWDRFVVKIGELTIAAGYLEGAIVAMVSRILGKSKTRLRKLPNRKLCEKLKEHVPSSRSDAIKKQLEERIGEIRNLYQRRNQLIHAAFMTVTDHSIQGIPPGSIIDGLTYGFGCTRQEGNVFSFGLLAKRVHLDDIERLTDDIHSARIALIPFLRLVDEIPQSPKSLTGALPGRLL